MGGAGFIKREANIEEGYFEKEGASNAFVLLDGQYKTIHSSGLNIKIQEISRWDICREQEGAEPSVITLPAPRLSGQDRELTTMWGICSNIQPVE